MVMSSRVLRAAARRGDGRARALGAAHTVNYTTMPAWDAWPMGLLHHRRAGQGTLSKRIRTIDPTANALPPTYLR